MTSGRRQLDEVSALLALAEKSNDLFSRHRPDASYLSVSPAFLRVLGHDPHDLVDTDPRALTHPDDLEAVTSAYQQVVESRASTTVRHRVRHHNGHYRWLESRMHVVDDLTGEVIEVQIVSRDITEQVEAEMDRERQAAFSNILMRLAVDFINAPLTRLDSAIEEALAEAGSFTAVDRAYLCRYTPGHGPTEVTHDWCRDGVAALPSTGRTFPVDPTWQPTDADHAPNRTFQVIETAQLGEQDVLRQHLEAQSTHSLATVPLRDDDHELGFLAFDSVTAEHRWTAHDEDLLQVLAELMTNALQRRDREEDLSGSRILLEIAGSVARFGGWVWDVDTNTTTWSAALRAMIGIGAGEEPGFEDLLEAVHPEDRALLRESSQRAVEHGEPWDFELRMPTTDGQLLWLRNVGRVERDEWGRVVRLWGAIQDVTVQHDASQALQELADQLTNTMDSVTDSIIVLGPDARVSYINGPGARMFGIPAGQLIGRSLEESVPEEVGGVFHDAECRAWELGTPQSTTGFYAALARWLEASFYPSRRGMTIYVRDVTERVQREQMLERVADAERATADRLRQLDAAKTAFLTAVSHELRTPLTVVQGMAETLHRLRGAPDHARRHDIEDALLDHARRLTRLVDDLLHIDRLSRGSLEARREPVDLATALRRAVAGSEIAPQVTCEVPEDLRVMVDPTQFQQVVNNLLANTAKYAPNSPVELRLAPTDDGGFRLDVRDEGPGIPPRALEHVFEPFVRLHEDHPTPGTGVGLTLVREFAKLHGGHAWAEDTTGRGAHIVVEIPGPEATASVETDATSTDPREAAGPTAAIESTSMRGPLGLTTAD